MRLWLFVLTYNLGNFGTALGRDEKAGVAGGYEALDSDQPSDQADQDGWATGTPRKEAGVSACRGAGNQGNADRDTRTDQPASAGTWLACFESTGISDSYGVVRGK